MEGYPGDRPKSANEYIEANYSTIHHYLLDADNHGPSDHVSRTEEKLTYGSVNCKLMPTKYPKTIFGW